MKTGERISGKDLADKTFEVIEDGLLKIVEETGKKFIPKKDELYYYISTYGNVLVSKNNSPSDEWLFKREFVFKSFEEAVEYKNYLEILDKYKHDFSIEDWKNDRINKWYLEMDVITGDIFVATACTSFKCAPCYFTMREYAEDFIEEAGEKNVRKFMFDIWE